MQYAAYDWIKNCKHIALSVFLDENYHLDELYTRYRQRLRKSLFTSGLSIALVASIIGIFFCCFLKQVNILIRLNKLLNL